MLSHLHSHLLQCGSSKIQHLFTCTSPGIVFQSISGVARAGESAITVDTRVGIRAEIQRGIRAFIDIFNGNNHSLTIVINISLFRYRWHSKNLHLTFIEMGCSKTEGIAKIRLHKKSFLFDMAQSV